MRVIAIMIITLVTGLAGIGAWVMLGPGGPSISSLGGDPAKKATRKRDQRRSAPYVILVPAETLPEKDSSAPPKPSAVKLAPRDTSSPSPAPSDPVQKKSLSASAPAASRAAKPPAISESAPIARQTLDAISGPQPEAKPKAALNPQTETSAVPEAKPEKESQPAARMKPKPVALAVTEPKPEPKRQPASQVKLKPAAPAPTPAAPPTPSPDKETPKPKQPQRKLTYEVETNRQAGEREKQQAFTAGEKVRFRRIIPLGSGRLKSNDRIIVLAGIDSLRANAKCKYASGKSWDCGRWGKYALRRFIRGRAVVCDLIEEISQTEISGRCKVAGKDINKWVVRRGWGQPSADNATAYGAALSAARKDKLGLWSEEPKSAPQALNQTDPVPSDPSSSGR